MKLTDEQRYVIKELIALKKPISTCGGYAGTGKTTLIRHIATALPRFSVCAFTGKAANVLRKKGISSASTIHSLIYKPWTDANGNVYFSLTDDINCEGIIIDEASMVSFEIYQDLQYFNIPLIFVGDHGQLEPVADKFNLMKSPDFTLEQIHRNAGEIAHFAEFIRKGYRPSAWKHRPNTGVKVKFVGRNYYDHILNVDQVICAYNKTRVEINREARKRLGKPSDAPVVDDRVICLRNNNLLGLFNGMQGKIANLKNKNEMTFEAEDRTFDIFYDPTTFNQVHYDFGFDRSDPMPFDYSWALTCHKCQGDEFQNVLVVEQRSTLWEHPRWAYTAASRAQDTVYWAAEN